VPELPVWFEIGSFVVLGIILAIDLLLVLKRPHEPSMKEAGLWVSFYIALALLFAGAVWYFGFMAVPPKASCLLPEVPLAYRGSYRLVANRIRPDNVCPHHLRPGL